MSNPPGYCGGCCSRVAKRRGLKHALAAASPSATAANDPRYNEVRDLINARASEQVIKAAARRAGMRTLFEDGLEKAAQGLTKGIPLSHKQHFEAKGVGHYGIFSGRKWRELIYPRIREFIARHT